MHRSTRAMTITAAGALLTLGLAGCNNSTSPATESPSPMTSEGEMMDSPSPSDAMMGDESMSSDDSMTGEDSMSSDDSMMSDETAEAADSDQ